MSTFIGKYEVKADAKGRIFIPSVYRKLLPQSDRARVVMRMDADLECLMIYPEDIWDAKVSAFKSQLDEWNPADQLLLMQYVADAEWMEIDSQGRILLSKKNMEKIGADSEILFVGMLDRIAVWSKPVFEKTMLNAAEFSQKLKSRMVQ